MRAGMRPDAPVLQIFPLETDFIVRRTRPVKIIQKEPDLSGRSPVQRQPRFVDQGKPPVGRNLPDQLMPLPGGKRDGIAFLQDALPAVSDKERNCFSLTERPFAASSFKCPGTSAVWWFTS